METTGFDIEIAVGRPDWEAAKRVPSAQLPAVSEGEKEFYRKLFPTEQMDFDKLARLRVAWNEGRKRLERTAESLGRIVVEVLGEIQADWRLDAVVLRRPEYWLLMMTGAKSSHANVKIPRALGQDLVEGPNSEDRERLKRYLQGAGV
jgi:hypothetical protein